MARAATSRVCLMPWMVAGVQTQYIHLRSELTAAGIDFSVAEIRPWVEGGAIERLPLPSRTRGSLRSLLSLAGATHTPAGVVWSQVALPLLPLMVARPWLRRAPVFYSIDCTPKQLFDFGEHYAQVSTDPASPKGRLTSTLLANFFRRCRGLLPWSRWAAESMVDDYGAEPARVHVVPPGVDVGRWTPNPTRSPVVGRCRLLFVGGDFARKGGPLLVDLFQHHLSKRCSLDLVTSRPVETPPGAAVHVGLAPNDPGLIDLYRAADVLVVPTYADCFSMAAIEAMACGVPVVTSPIGGIPEIVVEGETGHLIAPGDARSLLRVLERLVSDPAERRRLGEAGRERVVRRFNATTQAGVTMNILGTARADAQIAAAEASSTTV